MTSRGRVASPDEQSKIGHGLPSAAVRSEIGAIALLHAQLDNQLRMMIGDLLGLTKDQALNATERQGSQELRDRIKKLAKKRLGECREYALLQDLLTRCGRATRERNELLHAVWGKEIDRGGIFLRIEGDTFTRAPSRKDIERIARDLRGLLWEAIDARKGPDGFLRTSLDKIPDLSLP